MTRMVYGQLAQFETNGDHSKIQINFFDVDGTIIDGPIIEELRQNLKGKVYSLAAYKEKGSIILTEVIDKD